MTVKILVGDCRSVLATLPDESVHCVVTSPPYWGLRDYNTVGQLGLERSLGEHIAVMVEVFREVRRVLRKDGTLWLNYGDSYATSVNGRSAADTKATGNDDRTFRDKPFSTIGPINRVGASGNKGNSGADHGFRITAGQNRDDVDVGGWGASDQSLRWRGGGYLKPKDLCGVPWRVAFALQEDGWYLRQDIIWSKPNPMPESVRDRCTKAHEYLFLLAKSERYYFNQEGIAEPAVKAGRVIHSYGTGTKDRQDVSDTNDRRTRIGLANWNQAQPDTRNKRSVWEVNTSPFSEAHFATFPPALIEPCILAGCPQDGTVLDPFIGAGTTGLVADRLRRNCIGIELNPEYAAMAERRISDDAGMFHGVGGINE